MTTAKEAAALPGYYVRFWKSKDVPKIMDIENVSFDTPWTTDEMLRLMGQKFSSCIVIECQGEVAGFCIYELQRTRIEVLNLAVKPDCRMLGVGRALIGKLACKLTIKGRRRICTLVRETNLPAQMFLKSVGFVATAVAQAAILNYSRRVGMPEDALWFESLLIEPGSGMSANCEDGECKC